MSYPTAKYRPDLDGIRAVAVLSVCVFHAFPAVLPGGFVGVDIFFVISGYLISGIIGRQLAAGTFTFRGFYSRRIRRILPALLTVLAACWVAGWGTLLPGELHQLGKHVTAGVAFVSNFVLWGESGYFDAAATTKPLLHLWSLGIEEQFYIVWPLLLWLFWRRRGGALALIVGVGLASFAVNVATARTHPVAAFYSPLSRFWELQVGCLLAWLESNGRLPRGKVAAGASAAGAAALAVAIATFNAKLTFPGWWGLLPTVGTFLIIAAGPTSWVNRNILSRRAFVWVGLVSFPLYLWHWPLLSFAHLLSPTPPSTGLLAAALFASGALAVATYLLIERPIRFGGSERPKVAVLVALSVAGAFVGLRTVQKAGFPARVPPEVQAFADYKYEPWPDARYPRCWLPGLAPLDGFAPECVASGLDKPSVVVWGDSHSARLYAGLQAVAGATSAISQFTRDGCPPLLKFKDEACWKSNDFILSEVARIQAKTVILFAVWTHYQTDWEGPSAGRTGLLTNIEALKKAGVRDIIVMGPAPEWTGGLPKVVFNAMMRNPFGRVVPDRLQTGLDPVIAKADKQLRAMVQDQPVRYVSLLDLWCNGEGCLVHAPDQPTHLITFDYGHLTTDGAVMVARHLVAIRALL